ncbi:MAG: EF-Tu/IF-2/RF-3 family GTPase [Acutalibacteraceae bacterium]
MNRWCRPIAQRSYLAAPTVADYGSEIGVDIEGNPVEIAVNEDAATAAIVFKTVVDPFIGKLTFVKVVAGKLTADSPVINMRTGEQERMIKMYYMCGKKQEETKCICAGDIGAIPKLQHTNTGDTLCSPTRKVVLEGVTYPEPVLSMAILPKQKGEEDKVAQGVLRLLEEDPTLKFVNNAETHQMILSGLGEQHLDVVVSKLKGKFGLDVTLEKPKVAYRETIRKKVQAQGKHKKQTGGHGQFGDVWIEFEPSDSEGLEFEERVVGGAVPKGFFPAVEKDCAKACKKVFLQDILW